MARKKRGWIWGVICASLLLALLVGVYWQQDKRIETRGVFSWSSDVLQGEAREQMFADLQDMRVNVLYQWITSKADKAVVQEFLREAAAHGIDVWMLTGDPSWALDPQGERMIQHIDRLLGYHDGLEEEAYIKGVLMDVEAYVTDEWDEDPDAVMATWSSAMASAYAYAQEKSVPFYACIPYHMDSAGYLQCLEILVQYNCDGITIMNYHKQDEAGQIENEVRLANAAGKPVVVIYELQEAGEHGLKEINTYHTDGLEAVEKSFRAIRRKLKARDLILAYHDYKALMEVAAHE